MSEAKVIFSLDGINLTIQCTTNDKMKDIIKRYLTKINKNINSLMFLYGGNKVNYELSFEEQASFIDRNSHEMNILVNKNEENRIICPKCGEKIYLNTEKLNELKLSNDEINDSINGIKLQIDNIIKSSSMNTLNIQLKNINKMLNMINEDIKKNNEKINNLFDNIIGNMNEINNENKNNKKEKVINEGLLYECSNSKYLKVYIYQGTEETNFEIYLRNIGEKSWDKDSKLVVDPCSKCKTNDIILKPQKPDEELAYEVFVKDLKNYPPGDYKIVFSFSSGGRIYGEKIVAFIRIIEKEIKKNENEIDENIDKIKEFREEFNLTEDDYSNEELLKILKDNNFNYEKAFASLFE